MTEAVAPLHSPLLAAAAGVRHAFFTRRGGVSRGLYASLNAGAGARDDPAAVEQNRARCAGWFGAPADRLLTAYQVHSAEAAWVQGPWPAPEARPRADAVATATPGLVCGALSADCAPVLLVDPQARVVAAAHAGWRGAVGGIVAAAVRCMEAHGAHAGRIQAAVGPCIGPASYEVGDDFRAAVLAAEPAAGRFFTAEHAPGKRRFDLPGFVLLRLEQAGVGAAEALGRDTCAEPEVFFSNRRAVLTGEDDYGRLLSAIALEA